MSPFVLRGIACLVVATSASSAVALARATGAADPAASAASAPPRGKAVPHDCGASAPPASDRRSSKMRRIPDEDDPCQSSTGQAPRPRP